MLSFVFVYLFSFIFLTAYFLVVVISLTLFSGFLVVLPGHFLQNLFLVRNNKILSDRSLYLLKLSRGSTSHDLGLL